MTVKELRELLFKLENQDAKIIVECKSQEYKIDNVFTDNNDVIIYVWQTL